MSGTKNEEKTIKTDSGHKIKLSYEVKYSIFLCMLIIS